MPHRFHSALMEIQMEAMTNRTIVELVAFKRELTKIKTRGYAINDEELEKGLRALAAPIFNHTGEALAATNIVWTTARHPNRKAFELFTPQIVAAAEKISSLLGHIKRSA